MSAGSLPRNKNESGSEKQPHLSSWFKGRENWSTGKKESFLLGDSTAAIAAASTLNSLQAVQGTRFSSSPKKRQKKPIDLQTALAEIQKKGFGPSGKNEECKSPGKDSFNGDGIWDVERIVANVKEEIQRRQASEIDMAVQARARG